MKRLGLLLSLAMTVSLLVSACAPAATPAPPTATPVATATRPPEPTPTPKPQILVVAQSAPSISTFDPGRVFETDAWIVVHNCYSTLVTYEHGDVSKVKPDLATSWTISPDAKELTFDLRSNVKFASGNPVTADDVVWSLNRVKNIKGNPAWMLGPIEKVEAIGDRKVKITLSEPDTAYIAAFSGVNFSILDSELVKEHGGSATPDADQTDTAAGWLTFNSAGSGPFILTEYEPDVGVTLERNPNYYKGPAKLDSIAWRVVQDSVSQRLQLERGDVDVAADLTPEDVISLVDKPGVKIVSKLGIMTYFLAMTMDPALSEPLSNPKVQKAIRYAIDYEGVLKLVPGGAVHPPTIMPMGMLGSAPKHLAFKRDLTKAKQLLAEAGYPDGFKCTLTYNTGRAYQGMTDEILVQKIQNDLAEAGIQVELEPLEMKVELSKERAGELAFIPKSWGPDWPDVGNVLVCFQPGGMFAKRMRWFEEDDTFGIREIVAKALTEPDPDKKAELYIEAQKLLMENGPYVSLFTGELRIGIRDRVKGFDVDPWWILNGFEVWKE